MNMEIMIVSLAMLLVISLFAALRWQRRTITSLSDFQSRWNAVDLPALLNLIDRREEDYLRRNLSRRDFHFIHRQRLLATWKYMSRLSANAKLMVQAGQIIQHGSHGEQAAEARQLVADSVRLRTMVLMAQFSIGAKFVLPGMNSPITSMLDQYSAIRGSLEQAFTQRQIHEVSRLA